MGVLDNPHKMQKIIHLTYHFPFNVIYSLGLLFILKCPDFLVLILRPKLPAIVAKGISLCLHVLVSLGEQHNIISIIPVL